MSSELERRLDGVFAEAPEPDPGAGEKALHHALRALQPVAAPARRGLRTAVLVVAAALALLVIAAGSLAEAGALHVSLGTQTKKVPLTSGLLLPKGANGISAIVYDQLSATTKSGFRLQGRPVTRPPCRRTASTWRRGLDTRSSRWPPPAAARGLDRPASVARTWTEPAAPLRRWLGRRTASVSPTSSERTRGSSSYT